MPASPITSARPPGTSLTTNSRPCKVRWLSDPVDANGHQDGLARRRAVFLYLLVQCIQDGIRVWLFQPPLQELVQFLIWCRGNLIRTRFVR